MRQPINLAILPCMDDRPVLLARHFRDAGRAQHRIADERMAWLAT
jgi:hypothetical protein